MRYHWGLGVGHLYSREHHTASSDISSREADTTVRPELGDELVSEQLKQTLQLEVEGFPEKLDLDLEDGDSDSDSSKSSYPGSEAELANDSEDDMDSEELFDMFGDTQAMDLTSYD